VRLNGIACRVLVTGSAHVYAPSSAPLTEDAALGPSSPYALSKLAQEQLALRAADEDGIDVLVARSFNHTGPRQSPSFVAPGFARQVAAIERGTQEPVIRVGNLEAVRDLTDVRDTVRAYAAVMGASAAAGVYNVASGIGRSMGEILEAMLSRSRRAIRVERDPDRMRPSDIPVLVGDPTRLRQLTGWIPQVPFDQTVDDLLAYWRALPEV
jgi:GDP-4-dehydro-6-deoxy-D-mannose reductase